MTNSSIKTFTLAVLFLVLNSNLVQGQFGSEYNLSDLNGFNGFGMVGDAGDLSGAVVTGIGDINNDGVDDVLVAKPGYSPFFNAKGGKQTSEIVAYVVFGVEANQFPNPISLAFLNGFNGFAINVVIDETENFQVAASDAGDINGDGISDLVIGLDGLNNGAGRSYVVYGVDSAVFPNPYTLNSLNGLNGFAINGVNDFDNSGAAVGAAGDINGDGLDDLIIGAVGANSFAGSSYLIYGQDNTLFPAQFNLADIDGINGFVINGATSGDRSGTAVNAAGDINNDGLDDVVIGATSVASNGDNFVGASYVVFGNDAAILPSTVSLSALNGQNGFVINGIGSSANFGRAVSSAGDINGDGIDDLVIGARGARPNGNNEEGSAYVLFGIDTPLFPNPINASSLDGEIGFAVHGENAFDALGSSVSAAGDVNADGLDDIIIGAQGAEGSGASYVIYGQQSDVFTNPISPSDLNGENGFVIRGVANNDRAGVSVGAAGDLNADGIADLMIGANLADPGGVDNAGVSYVLFGREKPIFVNGFESQ